MNGKGARVLEANQDSDGTDVDLDATVLIIHTGSIAEYGRV